LPGIILRIQQKSEAPTGSVFPGDKGIPSTLAYTPYTNFFPRIGVAYSPSPSDGLLGKIIGGAGMTSIRAGKLKASIFRRTWLE
jgi:hypothetical protein